MTINDIILIDIISEIQENVARQLRLNQDEHHPVHRFVTFTGHFKQIHTRLAAWKLLFFYAHSGVQASKQRVKFGVGAWITGLYLSTFLSR